MPVLCLNGNGVDRELYTFVFHLTNITGNQVGKVGTRWSRYSIQQILGLLDIELNRTIDTTIQECIVNSHIVGSGLLPAQIRIRAAWLDQE